MKTANRHSRERGSAMVEFAIAGIAAVTLLISTVQVGLLMWNYHTLAHSVHETNRYIASHGRSCTMGGNACSITVGDIATKLKGYAIGLPDTAVTMTLTSQSGATVACNPLHSCLTSTTQWPPVAHFDNNPGNTTKIEARIGLAPAIIAMWYGTRPTAITSVTLPATSEIPIVF